MHYSIMSTAMTLRRLGCALCMPFISPFRVILKSGVYEFESSDDLINFCHLNTVFEFNSGY
ncbi:MAG: hypothetical protein KZQ60_10640, partial [Candidatus Thiodiazotropha sp. (ex Lucinoma aequizonata)]|nr:hypothetical protein [Candidatus Thiodiazotropha sp. (ex Lucinoma aequizonata)]